MARARARREVDEGSRRLLEALAREWGRSATRRLPPEFVGHMRAAAREVVLAVTALCDSVLKAAETRTVEARRRVERMSVTPAPPSRRRAPSKRWG